MFKKLFMIIFCIIPVISLYAEDYESPFKFRGDFIGIKENKYWAQCSQIESIDTIVHNHFTHYSYRILIKIDDKTIETKRYNKEPLAKKFVTELIDYCSSK